MKFGGHETFFLRPGWLTKGLFLVRDTESLTWNGDFASDAMGVGRNMSKSIGWWLNLTGLVHRPVRKEPLRLTPFGEAIIEHDPYLMDTVSWWFIHLATTMTEQENVFTWFFQEHREARFQRNALAGALVAHLESKGRQVSAIKTLQRDVAVLLQSYAQPIPAPDNDPEDNLDCPLRRLGLLIHRTELGVFERREATAKVPATVIAAALSLSLEPSYQEDEAGDVQIDFTGPVRQIGRMFGYDAEKAAECIVEACNSVDPDLLSLRHLVGQRFANVRKLPLDKWFRFHFNDHKVAAATSKDATRAA